MSVVDVIVTELQVEQRGDLTLTWVRVTNSEGMREGWDVWCEPCGDYTAKDLPSRATARAHADDHEHIPVDPVAALRQLRQHYGEGVA